MAAMVATDAGFPWVGYRKLLIRVQQMRPRGSVAVLALDIHHVRGQFRGKCNGGDLEKGDSWT